MLYAVRMNHDTTKTLNRAVEAAVVPVGTKVTLMKGEQAYITQSLGGAYTVIVNGNMFRIDGKDAGASEVCHPTVACSRRGGRRQAGAGHDGDGGQIT